MRKNILIVCFIFCIPFVVVSQNYQKIQLLEKKGDSLIYDWSYEKNHQIRKQILSELKNNKNSLEYKKATIRLIEARAYVFNGKSNFDSAVYYSQKAIDKYNEFQLENNLLKGKIYRALYHHTAYLGKWSEALPIANESLQSLLDTLPKQHDLVIDAQFDTGYIYAELGDYSKSLTYYENSLKDRISLYGEIHHKVALNYIHLSTNYKQVGMFKKELEALKKATFIWENIKENRTSYDDKSYLYVCYNKLAKWYTEQGDLKKAENYLIKNELLYKKYGNRNWIQEFFKGQTQILSWESLAKMKIAQKDTMQALGYLNKTIRFFDEKQPILKDIRSDITKEYYLATALNLKANLLEKQQPKLAKKLYEKSIVLIESKKTSKAIKTTDDRINLSNLYLKQEAFLKAKIIVNEGLVKAKNNFFDILKYYNQKGNIAYLENDISLMTNFYTKAFRAIQKDTLKSINLKNIQYTDLQEISNDKYINFIHNTSLNYKAIYQKTKKSEYLKTAHNLNVLLTDVYSDNLSAFRYNDKTYSLIQKINEEVLNTSLLIKEKKITTILEKIAQNASKFSWQKFLNANSRKNSSIPDSILRKENEVKSLLNFYKKSLYTTKNITLEKEKLWKEKVFDLENELQDIEKYLELNYLSFYKQTQKNFDLKTVRNKLNNKQQIIKYVVSSHNIYAFNISKKETKLIKIGTKKNILSLLKPFINSLKQPNGFSKENSKKLYNLLLPKTIVNTSKKNLIIIPDNILQYIPFEILINQKNDYLIKNYNISYASSLLLWEEQNTFSKISKNKKIKVGIFAPSYSMNFENQDNSNFSKLSGAKSEAISLSKIFNSELFLGKKASKSTFLKNANQFSILHLAMHSILNNDNAEFSNLQFYGNTEQDKLFISEIYNLQLNTDLVVLSACNTGVGKLEKGEGLVNLSRAFTYAGISSSVISLWETPDKSTKEIMNFFYIYLKEGYSKSEALKKAKIKYINSTEDTSLQQPYFWAGFIINGNTDALVQDNNWFVYILISVILFVLFLLIKKKLL